MNIKIEIISDENISQVEEMLNEFFQYHFDLNNRKNTKINGTRTLKQWIKNNDVYCIFSNEVIVGFINVRNGGTHVVYLDDIYIEKNARRKGIGKKAIDLLENKILSNGYKSLCVNVIPKNIEAIKFYIECGFDHLNMIELRKNYDNSFNKLDDVELLGYKFKV